MLVLLSHVSVDKFIYLPLLFDDYSPSLATLVFDFPFCYPVSTNYELHRNFFHTLVFIDIDIAVSLVWCTRGPATKFFLETTLGCFRNTCPLIKTLVHF